MSLRGAIAMYTALCYEPSLAGLQADKRRRPFYAVLCRFKQEQEGLRKTGARPAEIRSEFRGPADLEGE